MTSASTPSRSMSLTRRCGSVGAADALLAVLVEAGRGHDVDAVVLARARTCCRPGPTPFCRPNDGAVLGGPVRPVGGRRST